MQWEFVSVASKKHKIGSETAHSHGFRYCEYIFIYRLEKDLMALDSIYKLGLRILIKESNQ